MDSMNSVNRVNGVNSVNSVNSFNYSISNGGESSRDIFELPKNITPDQTPRINLLPENIKKINITNLQDDSDKEPVQEIPKKTPKPLIKLLKNKSHNIKDTTSIEEIINNINPTNNYNDN